MPTMRRPSHCFCLFTVLALACDTSSSATPRRAAVQPPPPVSAPATRAEPGTYNLRGTPMTGRTRRVELNFDIPDSQLTIKVGEITVPGTMSLHAHSIDELEIYDVRDGMVRHGRLTHVVDKTVSKRSPASFRGSTTVDSAPARRQGRSASRHATRSSTAVRASRSSSTATASSSRGGFRSPTTEATW